MRKHSIRADDRISSIRVFGGAGIRLCVDPGYGGFCRVITTDTPGFGALMNNRASSYQTW